MEEQLWTVGSLVLGGRSTLALFGESAPCETAFTATSRSFLLSPLFYPHPHPTALIVLDVASSLLVSLFFHNLANTDTLIPLGSITLLRLHLVDIHVHDSISTFAPSTDPSFSNLHSADSTNIPFFFLPDTAKHLYHTFTNF